MRRLTLPAQPPQRPAPHAGLERELQQRRGGERRRARPQRPREEVPIRSHHARRHQPGRDNAMDEERPQPHGRGDAHAQKRAAAHRHQPRLQREPQPLQRHATQRPGKRIRIGQAPEAIARERQHARDQPTHAQHAQPRPRRLPSRMQRASRRRRGRPGRERKLLPVHQLPLERHREQDAQRGQQERPRQQRHPGQVVPRRQQPRPLHRHERAARRVSRRRRHRLRASQFQQGQRAPGDAGAQAPERPMRRGREQRGGDGHTERHARLQARVEVGGAGEHAQPRAQEHRAQGELGQPAALVHAREPVCVHLRLRRAGDAQQRQRGVGGRVPGGDGSGGGGRHGPSILSVRTLPRYIPAQL
ncbi:hypothetical protein COEX109129_37560 [Corallococcus exiguus]